MTKFLKRTGLFICLWLFCIVAISMFLNYYVGSKAYFKLDNNIKSVVFGHSHPETAYNDSLIANFKNLAQSGESYFYTYLKAKKVLNQNPQIKNVFIEFTNIDVTQIRDKEIWSDKYINWRYQNYSSLMDFQDWFLLASKNPKSITKTLAKTFKKQVSRIQTKQYNYFPATSGYLYIKESKLDSLLQTKITKNNPDSDYYKESVYNLLYLEKLVALCKEKKLTIYFVRSPLYKDSFYLSNNNLYTKVKNNKFPDIELLDLVNFQLINSEYRDLHHVNYKGAKKVSLFFNNWIKENTTLDFEH